jgi:SAM-dependent methyltransferase
VPELPDLSDPRYLDEVGWFLHYKHKRRYEYGKPYDDERLENSRVLLEDIPAFCGISEDALRESTVLTIGCGCTAELAAWPARTKLGVDPMLYVYQHLGMLIDDAPGTSSTIYIPAGAEDIPLVDGCADLTICRNALDHIPDPAPALAEIARVTAEDGIVFISVDLGGEPTPDEPTVFSEQSLRELLDEHLDVLRFEIKPESHSGRREAGVLVTGRPLPRRGRLLDADEVLAEYSRRTGWDAYDEDGEPV